MKLFVFNVHGSLEKDRISEAPTRPLIAGIKWECQCTLSGLHKANTILPSHCDASVICSSVDSYIAMSWSTAETWTHFTLTHTRTLAYTRKQ